MRVLQEVKNQCEEELKASAATARILVRDFEPIELPPSDLQCN